MGGTFLSSCSLIFSETCYISFNRYVFRLESPKCQKMVEFRKTLPAYKEKETLLRAISANQVILVSGETGCGILAFASGYGTIQLVEIGYVVMGVRYGYMLDVTTFPASVLRIDCKCGSCGSKKQSPSEWERQTGCRAKKMQAQCKSERHKSNSRKIIEYTAHTLEPQMLDKQKMLSLLEDGSKTGKK